MASPARSSIAGVAEDSSHQTNYFFALAASAVGSPWPARARFARLCASWTAASRVNTRRATSARCTSGFLPGSATLQRCAARLIEIQPLITPAPTTSVANISRTAVSSTSAGIGDDFGFRAISWSPFAVNRSLSHCPRVLAKNRLCPWQRKARKKRQLCRKRLSDTLPAHFSGDWQLRSSTVLDKSAQSDTARHGTRPDCRQRGCADARLPNSFSPDRYVSGGCQQRANAGA